MIKKEISEKILEIFKQQVFELNLFPDKKEAYIPYMMNDAVENYLIMKNYRMKGEYISDYKGEISGEISETDGQCVLIVRQGNKNTFTLWFDEIEEKKNFYRYHEIGHFWVKGHEQWRQLVYMIGTAYDKYTYLGETSCNQKEKELLPLMEFAPFRFFSPINESLDSEYPDTIEGCDCAHTFAKKAGNYKLAFAIMLYKNYPFNFVKKYIIHLLKTKNGISFYEEIREHICDASAEYSARDYGEEKNTEIAFQRKDAERKLQNQGFMGSYPFFYKKGISILAVEEHPFTTMETTYFTFKIQFMISKYSEKQVNSGFFLGKGFIKNKIQ